jgi:hypothetical protein
MATAFTFFLKITDYFDKRRKILSGFLEKPLPPIKVVLILLNLDVSIGVKVLLCQTYHLVS